MFFVCMHVKNHNSHCHAFPPDFHFDELSRTLLWERAHTSAAPRKSILIGATHCPACTRASTLALTRSGGERRLQSGTAQDGRGGVANYMQVSSAAFPSPLLRSTSEEMTASWQALQLEGSPSPPPPHTPNLPPPRIPSARLHAVMFPTGSVPSRKHPKNKK